MRPSLARRLSALLLIAMPLVAATACGDSTGPGIWAPRVAGTWDLVSGDGSPYSTGRLVLSPLGTAELQLSGSYSGEPLNVEYDGSFRLESDGRIRFTFVEPTMSSRPSWSPGGVVAGERLEIRYPNPADGPDIVLTFGRLPAR